MFYRLIGDVHGKFKRYKKIIKSVERSRQVGDFGVGFFYVRGEERVACENPPYLDIKKGDHKFHRGNHDNLNVCKRQDYWIPDGTVEDTGKNKIMYIGGAVSVDKPLRHEGLDWWEDEELSMAELYDIVDKYIEVKPSVLLTHDCPEFFSDRMEEVTGRRKKLVSSRTRQAFDIMYDAHRPDLHVFGHWHHTHTESVKGTELRCLGELAYFDVDL